MESQPRDFRFSYPELPVAEKRGLVAEALAKYRVLIVEGGTGSGKSTQLPKILLESGVLKRGMLGVTQPRRLAALALTDRLREECGEAGLIGSHIRFHDDMPAEARVKVMTDGVLLQEYRRDPLLRRYDAIILDEAHERSLNIDLLLGVGLEICRRRADFKWIVASATLDAERFQAYFSTVPGGAGLLRVEGRQFPVTVEYLDPGDGWLDSGEDNRDGGMSPLEAARQAILDIMTLRPDDLLCFLPTEKEINELARELEKDLANRCVILPLYGRLSPAEQRRVYIRHGRPKVVLATNIAETSLTIPGIAYVVDTGTARVLRYHPQTRIQGLPIEKIAQASAAQRAGRAGRVKPGLCVRLYSREDFESRPEWPEPEILRGNLTNVVLQLLSLGLPVLDFPFLDPPTPAALKGAYRQLQELGAAASEEGAMRLTELGRRMSRLPVDAALAKILLTAEAMGVLPAAMVVAAGLTVQDARILPPDEPERGRAVGLHRRFDDPGSDFLSLLKLWLWLHREWRDGYSQGRLRKLCGENFLPYLRVREWMDLVEQFSRLLPGKGDPFRIEAAKLDEDALHKAILSGFLSHLARRKPHEPHYRLIGDKEAVIHSGSGLSKKRPEWIVAGEIRQTSRTFIQRACEIKPLWIEEVAPDAVKRSYSDVAWNPERGFVEAIERVTYRGFVLRQDKKVDFAKVDPEGCADIFWREAVIRENSAGAFDFISHNRHALETLLKHEDRIRLRKLVPDEDTLLRFYREKAPGVHSRITLNRFLAGNKEADRQLRLQEQDFETAEDKLLWQTRRVDCRPASPAPGNVHPLLALFPETMTVGGRALRINCRFDYGRELDGLSMEADLAVSPALTLALLWRELPGWRLWVLEWLKEKLPGKEADVVSRHESTLLAAWDAAMLDAACERDLSPVSALHRALVSLDIPELSASAKSKLTAGASQWPPHLKIKLFLISATGRRLLLAIDPGTCQAEIALNLAEQIFGKDLNRSSWDQILHSAYRNFGEAPPPLAVPEMRWTPRLWRLANGKASDDRKLAGYRWERESRQADFDQALALHWLGFQDPAPPGWVSDGQIQKWLARRYRELADLLRVPPEDWEACESWMRWQIESYLPAMLAQDSMACENGSQLIALLERDWVLPKIRWKNAAPVKSFQALQPLHAGAGGKDSAVKWWLWMGAGFLGPEALKAVLAMLGSDAEVTPAWQRALKAGETLAQTPHSAHKPVAPVSCAALAFLALPPKARDLAPLPLPSSWEEWESWQSADMGASSTTKKGAEKAMAEGLRAKLRSIGLLPQNWPSGWGQELDRFASGESEAGICLRLEAFAAREALKRQGLKTAPPETKSDGLPHVETLKNLKSRFKKL